MLTFKKICKVEYEIISMMGGDIDSGWVYVMLDSEDNPEFKEKLADELDCYTNDLEIKEIKEVKLKEVE